MKKKISLLIPHPSNEILYGDAEPDQVKDLAENINTYGQITPVVINKSNLILSGHRRISALKMLGRTFAECTIQDIDPADEPFYLIAANKQREKNMVQLSNEIEMLYDLYSKGRGFRSDLHDPSCASKTHTKTRDRIASELGISNTTISHLRFIRQHRAISADRGPARQRRRNGSSSSARRRVGRRRVRTPGNSPCPPDRAPSSPSSAPEHPVRHLVVERCRRR